MLSRVLARQISKPVAKYLSIVYSMVLTWSPAGMAQLPEFQRNANGVGGAVSQVPPDSVYLLGPGDQIHVFVENLDIQPILGDYLIPTDGAIDLPVVGVVTVAGLTVEQASQQIASKYLRLYKEPHAIVRLVRPRALDIVVAGEVATPGSYIMSVQNPDAPASVQFPRVTNAIQLAGGLTLTANPREIKLRRRQPDGSEIVVNLNLWEMMRTGDINQNLVLRDGDTIFIPTATEVNLSELRQLATASLASDINSPRTVAVLGEVAKPGSYVIKGGDAQLERLSEGIPTLSRALQLAGGVTWAADIRTIKVRRQTKGGIEQVFTLNLWQFLQEGDISQDIVLQDGDTIFIPTSIEVNPAEARQLRDLRFGNNTTTPRTVGVVGEVNRPGTYVVQGGDAQSERLSTGVPTLTRALQLAGGITPMADIRRIQVRRPARVGAERVFQVNLWQLLSSGDFNQDLVLEDGDTIVIPTATEINPAEAAELAAANFSPANIRIYVVGEEARSPGLGPTGEAQVPSNTPLNQALLATGGLNRIRANKSEVELIRLQPDGTVNRRSIKLDLTAGINDATNPILRNNDIIVVSRSNLSRATDTIDTISGLLVWAPRVEQVIQLMQRIGIIERP
ncbi:MAG TPA: SLBB domain-containing protein [Oscillatoriaceae cyanobacterium M33_DOE_052]|uniref:Uncharacterized protein n=1 Tax=Planktothricoides sp. SpSt-374 TaxID=2282167 RepID=A0A7C3VGH5_9CYAN|nr:SLBB domain-containing protein [Oscillatoriaceae cyanobacterium M33_DOE_052]